MPAKPTLSLDVPFPCIMGIVNVTPDSFSDGGRFLAPEAAIAQGLALVRDGAAIVDVGGESTRPGSDPVTEEQELSRVVPVVGALAGHMGVPISVDTVKAAVARAALAAGAGIVNDVSALRADPEMVDVVAEAGCPVCLMHMLGQPKTMQDDPRYDDVVDEVLRFLEERMAFALGRGVREDQLLIDPGIGFGKTVEHNLQLLRGLDRFVALGRPVVLGASRKRFLGAILGAEPDQRVMGTAATTVVGALAGVSVFRVHDVKPNFEALRVALAVLEGAPAS
jgi:dihydropteroate synthase